MADVSEKYQQAGPKVLPGAKEEMVYTWPYLVSIEAIMAVVMIFALTLLSTFFSAPLLDLANPEVTPNPSKAPWYFLGLQELLLHMHPALAGVMVPTAALVLLGMVPYIDRDRRGTGIWFSTKRGPKIALFAAIYTWIVELALLLFDEFAFDKFWHFSFIPKGSHGIEPFVTNWLMHVTGASLDKVDWVGKIFLPTTLMISIPWFMVALLKKRFKNMNTRETMIALYSFYLASFIILTIVGTAFRGHSMKLLPPWNMEGK